MSRKRKSDILLDVAKKNDVTIKDVIGPCRNPEFFRARKAAALAMKEAGYKTSEIARILNRSPSTIRGLFMRERRKLQIDQEVDA